MALIDRYLQELEGLAQKVALESLSNIADEDKTEFGFGRRVGRLDGIHFCQQLFNDLMNEAANEKKGPKIG